MMSSRMHTLGSTVRGKAAPMARILRTMRRAIAPVLVVGWSLLPAATVSAGTATTDVAYPPEPGSIDLTITTDPDPVPTNTDFVVTVAPCEEGALTTITFEGDTVSAECVSPNAQATFRSPSQEGTYPLTVVAYGQTFEFDIRVVDDAGGFWQNVPLVVAAAVAVVTTAAGTTTVIRRYRIKLPG